MSNRANVSLKHTLRGADPDDLQVMSENFVTFLKAQAACVMSCKSVGENMKKVHIHFQLNTTFVRPQFITVLKENQPDWDRSGAGDVSPSLLFARTGCPLSQKFT